MNKETGTEAAKHKQKPKRSDLFNLNDHLVVQKDFYCWVVHDKRRSSRFDTYHTSLKSIFDEYLHREQFEANSIKELLEAIKRVETRTNELVKMKIEL